MYSLFKHTAPSSFVFIVLLSTIPCFSSPPLPSVLLLSRLPGEEKLNILEIVKPVETVEVVIDPDAAGEEGTLVEEGQLIAMERSTLADDTSEQVTRWAAALEGYRKEQVRLGIPYGETQTPCVCRVLRIRKSLASDHKLQMCLNICLCGTFCVSVVF